MSELSAELLTSATGDAAAVAAPRLAGVGPWRCTWQRLRRSLAGCGIGGGIVSVLDQGVVSAANFATAVVIGRSCTPHELGQYSLALTVVLFARGAQEQVVSVPYMVHCHDRRGAAASEFAGSALVHHGGLTLLTVLGLAVLTLASGTAGLGPAAWAALGALPFLLLREFIRHFAFARLRPGTALRIDVTVSLLQVAALGVLAWRGAVSVAAAYAVLGLACAASGVSWLVANRHEFRPRAASVRRDWSENWKFGRWALASMLIGSTAAWAMPWILAMFQNEAATGQLYACLSVTNLANTFVIGMSNVLSPRAAAAMAAGGTAALGRVLRMTALIFVLGLGAFCAVMLIAGDRVAVLIYGPDFAESRTILSLLSLSVLAGSLGITVGNGLWALQRPAANMGADACAFVVTLGAAMALAGPYGPAGAAAALLLGAASGAAVRALILRCLIRQSPVRPECV